MLKAILPKYIILAIRYLKHLNKIIKAQKKFNHAAVHPQWLSWDELENLQKKYHIPKAEYGYDDRSTEERGRERALFLLKLTKNKAYSKFLEIGCQDGMVSYALMQHDKKVAAIDIDVSMFDKRAIAQGVPFYQNDATSLQFEDESFDFVFSFNGFEHFSDPSAVLKEMHRVTKKAGGVYINFGSPYMSSKGLHAYYSISVPFCQHLFPKEMLSNYIKMHNLPEVDFNSVNGWTMEDYRQLWKSFGDLFKKINYQETTSYEHLDLIIDYPSCFKSKSLHFNNFTTAQVEILFQKI